MDKVFSKSGDTDQTPPSMLSDLGLLYLSFTLLGVSRLQCWAHVNNLGVSNKPGNLTHTLYMKKNSTQSC